MTAVEQWEDSLPLVEQRVDHPYLDSPMEVFRENVVRHSATYLVQPVMILKRAWRSSAMFLLGLFLGRTRILYDVTRPNLPLIRRVCGWGIGIGAASALAEWFLTQRYGYAVFAESTVSSGVRFLGDMLFTYGSTALALGYGAGIVLLAQRPSWQAALRPLENLGRMALTVYLSQHGNVHHPVLRMGIWPAVPAGAGRHHPLCRSLLCDTADVLHLVVGQIQVRAS